MPILPEAGTPRQTGCNHRERLRAIASHNATLGENFQVFVLGVSIECLYLSYFRIS